MVLLNLLKWGIVISTNKLYVHYNIITLLHYYITTYTPLRIYCLLEGLFVRERLKSVPSEQVVKYLFGPALMAELNRSYENMLEINKAHLRMLISQEIVSLETGQRILAVLEQMEQQGRDSLKLDPHLEDLYFNMEAFIINQVGIEIGGQLHTGRSRNDLYATLTRMNGRSSLLNICEQLIKLRYSLLRLAQENLLVVMSGYTHLQPAEPITFAHYISAILHALERDYYRLEHAVKLMNLSPLGSGALASTTFPINREQTAKLLGFSDILGNSLDGVASRDYLLEALSACNILMSNLSRFSHDLYVWSTEEFAIVEVGDDVAACSSIMPQKKNPITLEHIKAKAAHVLGALVSATTSLKNIPYGHCRDAGGESPKYYWDAIFEVEASLQLMIATINTLKIKKERMLTRAAVNYSTVTELANTLVREGRLSFREAHHVVAHLVAEATEQGKLANQIDHRMLRKASLAVLGREVVLTDESIRIALDPTLNVQSKDVAGGPAPEEVQSQLKKLKTQIDCHSDSHARQKASLDEARRVLKQEVEQLLSANIGGS